MRNKKWDLVWGVLAFLIITGNIAKGNPTTELFGFEINSWIYRGIWLLVAIANLSQFFVRKRKEKNN